MRYSVCLKGLKSLKIQQDIRVRFYGWVTHHNSKNIQP